MNTRPVLYRSTLIAAAVAVGCLGMASVAAAHDHDGRDRGHDSDRHGYAYAPRGWAGRGEHRGWEYARPSPAWRPVWRRHDYDGDRGYYGDYYSDAYRDGYPVYRAAPAYGGYPPVVVYRPAPSAGVLYDDGDVSVMIHVPL